MSRFNTGQALILVISITVFITTSCSTSGPGLFAKKSPHEQYADKITNAGLNRTALGRRWLEAADMGLSRPLTIELPYRETGYFPAEKPQSLGLRFTAKRGEKLKITLDKKPATDFLVYMDLWQPATTPNGKPKLLQSADTTAGAIEYEVGREETFVLRIQPELLKGGEYTVNISTGPSLAFPVPAKSKPRVQSFWGAGRDNGARRHEGIDIFAPFRTPVVAAENGLVYRVEETNIGGKVLWLRPEQRPFTLYYAHLDSQIAREGQRVRTGDTLGLMGNTGNARTTAPHLHFGIYAVGGAVDPFPFVNPASPEPSPVTATLTVIGNHARTQGRTRLYPEPNIKASAGAQLEGQTFLEIRAATKNWYKVTLPEGEEGFLPSSAITNLDNPIRKVTLKASAGLHDLPDSSAARKKILQAGNTLDIRAAYKNYFYVDAGDVEGWIQKQVL